MSDLICRKTMMRCNHPGMCSPHGGCQPDKTEWQSGYDEGRRLGVKTALEERDRLKFENEILRAELAGLRTGYEAYESVNKGLKTEVEALRKEREGMALVPVTPSEGLLMSMAIRNDHALGCPCYYDQKLLGRTNNGVSHVRMVECAIGEMRKLHEEVVGAGFYSPQKESDYAAMGKGGEA